MLQKLFDAYKKIDNSEFEIRFGKFNKGFKPELTKEDYDSLISFFDEFKLKTDVSEFTQIVYDDKTRERLCKETGELKERCIKKKVECIDDVQMGCRYALSTEKKIKAANHKEKSKIVKRDSKKRKTYFLSKNFRLDFTCSNNTHYEVELEMIRNDTGAKVLFAEMIKHSSFILKVINKTNILCGISEQKAVTKSFMSLGVKFNNCKNIKRRDIETKKLVFTEKIDGERNYMFTTENGEAYIVNSRMNVRKAGVNFGVKLGNSVFDTECVYDIHTGLTIHVFDIMVINKNDVGYDIMQRIEKIKEIFGTGSSNIKTKAYFTSSSDLSELVKKNDDTDFLDGIIFSTTNSSYKETIHLKWKPVQTVDLKVINNKFYAYDKNGDCEIKCGAPQIPSSAKNNDVLEFTIDKTGELSFFKHRRDKQKGNFIDCVNDIMDDAKNNISSPELLNLYQQPQPQQQQQPQQPKQRPQRQHQQQNYEFRKFHNYIKKRMFNTYLKENDRLLELACGKGGDLHKWECAYVLGLDIDKKFLDNAKYRNENVGRNCDFRHIDLTTEVLLNKYPELCMKKFDICSIQFAIHYMFKSQDTFENLIKNINSGLKKGGILIGSCMDEDFMKDTDNDLFSLKMDEKNDTPFGNKVSVNFNNDAASSEGILRGDNTEFVVSKLVDIMGKYGFSLIKKTNFKKYIREYKKKLTAEEELFSSMNTTFAFVKN